MESWPVDVLIDVDPSVVTGQQVAKLVSDREPLPEGGSRHRGQDQLGVVGRGREAVEPVPQRCHADIHSEHGLDHRCEVKLVRVPIGGMHLLESTACEIGPLLPRQGHTR